MGERKRRTCAGSMTQDNDAWTMLWTASCEHTIVRRSRPVLSRLAASSPAPPVCLVALARSPATPRQANGDDPDPQARVSAQLMPHRPERESGYHLAPGCSALIHATNAKTGTYSRESQAVPMCRTMSTMRWGLDAAPLPLSLAGPHPPPEDASQPWNVPLPRKPWRPSPRIPERLH